MGPMGAVVGQVWGMHTRIYRPHGSSNGACIRAYIAIYGGIHGPHGSSNGAAMGHVCAHIWPYMGAVMGQQWGMYARIHNHIWGQ